MQRQYDIYSSMLTQTQCGVTTTYEYDENGSRLSETRPQSAGVNLLTRFEYDNNGRLTKTIYPDNTYTTTAYDSLGKPVIRTDKAGRETATVYDDMRRVQKVTHPDGRYEVTE